MNFPTNEWGDARYYAFTGLWLGKIRFGFVINDYGSKSSGSIQRCVTPFQNLLQTSSTRPRRHKLPIEWESNLFDGRDYVLIGTVEIMQDPPILAVVEPGGKCCPFRFWLFQLVVFSLPLQPRSSKQARKLREVIPTGSLFLFLTRPHLFSWLPPSLLLECRREKYRTK